MIALNRTQLLGHRGARSEALENTLFGFEHAKRLQSLGLAGIEFDVQLTFDGHLVVFHDDTLQRLCGNQSRIDQLTLKEIRRQLQFGHPIITLETLVQVLNTSDAIAATFSHIELEIKTHSRTSHQKLIQALNTAFSGAEIHKLPIVLTTFDRQLLQQLQRHPVLKQIPRGLLIRTPEALTYAANSALQLGCQQLGVYYPLLTQAVIQNCHRYGLKVSAWTVNDLEVVKQLVFWQVDVIITDIPTQIL